jgi:hypothetical protein
LIIAPLRGRPLASMNTQKTATSLVSNPDAQPRTSHFGTANTSSFIIVALFYAAIFGLSVAGQTQAASDPSVTSGEAQVSQALRFGPPQRYKFDVYPRAPLAEDFNNDGRLDLMIYDTASNLFVLLESEKNAETQSDEFRLDGEGDWVWRPKKRVLSVQASALRPGDYNGDGLTDLAVASTQGRAFIFYQDETGLKESGEELDYKADRLARLDVNGDGRDDLVLAQDEEFLILQQDADGNLEVAQRFSSSEAPLRNPAWVDLNGDNLNDLMYTAKSNKQRLVMRVGMPGGKIGPEYIFELEDYFDLVSLESGELAYLEPATRALNVLNLQKDDAANDASGIQFTTPQFFPFPAKVTGGIKRLVAFNAGDGQQGLVASLPESAELLLFVEKDGFLQQKAMPAPLDIADLAVLPAADGDTLYLRSGSEKLLASFALNTRANPGFPTALAADQIPLALTVGPTPLDAKSDDETHGVWVLQYPDGDDEEDLTLQYLSEEADELAWSLPETDEREPVQLIVAHLNADTHADALIFYDFEDPQLFLYSPDDEEYIEVTETDSIARGLLEDLEPQHVALGDLPNTHQRQLIASSSKYVRLYAFDADNKLTIRHQLNPPDRTADLTVPCLADLDGNGHADVAVVDEANQRLLVFEATDATTFAEPMPTKLPNISPTSMMAAQLLGDDAPELVLHTSKGILLMQQGAQEWSLESVSTRLTDIDDGIYGQLFDIGSFDAEQHETASDLVLIEARENMLEILRPQNGGEQLEELYRFKVFNQNRQLDDSQLRSRTPEPHDATTADVNQDGLIDLIVLAHKNIIVYLQLPEE